MNRTLIVGHRGVGALAPENSLKGFRLAVEMKLDAVEFDVHLTKDRAPIVLHDPGMGRTTDIKGIVGDLLLRDCRAARLKKTDEAVPTLDEVLDVLAPSSAELHIELKTNARGEPYEGIEDIVVEKILGRSLESRTIFTSFTPLALHRVRAIFPQARILCSINRASAEAMGGYAKALAAFSDLENCLFAIERKLLWHARDETERAIGADRLGVWVIDKAAEVKLWRDHGVRQITTNRPDIAITTLEGA